MGSRAAGVKHYLKSLLILESITSIFGLRKRRSRNGGEALMERRIKRTLKRKWNCRERAWQHPQVGTFLPRQVLGKQVSEFA